MARRISVAPRGREQTSPCQWFDLRGSMGPLCRARAPRALMHVNRTAGEGVMGGGVLQDEDGAEIVDVGVGRARDDQVADRIKVGVGVMAGGVVG